MKTYPIADLLADTYRGAGWALVALLDGKVVALRYVEDVAPEIADHLDGDHAAFFVRQWLQTAPGAAAVRELQALGQVAVGMLSGGEFTEL